VVGAGSRNPETPPEVIDASAASMLSAVGAMNVGATPLLAGSPSSPSCESFAVCRPNWKAWSLVVSARMKCWPLTCGPLAPHAKLGFVAPRFIVVFAPLFADRAAAAAALMLVTYGLQSWKHSALTG
jgi:hypothetical protein